MARILVVEPDPAAAGRIEHALRQKDWEVVSVAGIEAAMQTTAEQETHAVIIGPGVPSPREVVGTVSHGQAGGVPIAVLSERPAADLGLTEMPRLRVLPVDASPGLLAAAVREGLESAPANVPAMGTGRELTSEQLFGDVLAEMALPEPVTEEPLVAEPAVQGTGSEADVDEEPPGVPSAVSEQPPAPPTPRRRPVANPDIDRVLEETLSGNETESRPRKTARTARKERADEVDSLLGGALKGLEGSTPRKARKEETRLPDAFEELERTVTRTVSKKQAESEGDAARAAASAAADESAPASVLPETAPAESEALKQPAPGPVVEEEPAEKKETPAESKTSPPESKKSAKKVRSAGKKDSSAGETIEFGSYQLVQRIALGGMAEVWRARMRGVEGFEKVVAIKKILPHLTDNEEFSEMFVDEAKLAAQLTHNNIIHIYDFGKIGSDYFLAMEYVEGKDMRAILNAGRRAGSTLPIGLTLLVGSRLASALHYAHRKKDFEDHELRLVHRDVSPQNVLISYEGDIKLCDFGIAKAVSKVSKTQMGALKGKIQYMSPEQAWGEAVDARSDIFSLGVLLFEMLTGERLFAGSNEISILEAVRECRVRGPRVLNPEIPEAVNELVLKALSKDPKDRYQTAGEMQEDLEARLRDIQPTPTTSDLARYVRALFGADGEAARSPERKEERARKESESAAAVEIAQPLAASVGDEGGSSRWMLYGGIAAVAVIGILAVFWLTGRAGTSSPAVESVPAQTQAAVQTPAAATGQQSAGPETSTQSADVGGSASDLNAAVPAENEASQASTPATATDTTAKPAAENAGSPAAAKTSDVASDPTLKALDAMVAEEVSKREEALRKKMEAEQERLRKQIEEANRIAAPESKPVASKAAKTESSATTPVKIGELVQAGPGVTAPRLISSLNPNYPASAAQQPAGTQVAVSALVDENGSVIKTRLDSGVASEAGINDAAIAAVRGARFRAATKNGVKVKMWYKLNVPVR